jgi:ariadne-1
MSNFLGFQSATMSFSGQIDHFMSVARYEEWDFIRETGQQIRAILVSNESNSAFVDEVVAHHSTSDAYPADLLPRIASLLIDQVPRSESQALVDSLCGIADNPELPENADALFGEIFCPADSPAASGCCDASVDEIELDEPQYATVDKILTTPTLLARQQAAAARASDVLSIDRDVAFLLLQLCQWREESLFARWTDEAAALLNQIGLKPGQAMGPIVLRHPPGDAQLECSVCYTEFEPGAFLGLPCGHFFCIDCWIHQVKGLVRGGAVAVGCMAFKCQCRVVPSDVRRLCGAAVADQYASSVVENHIATNPNLAHCLRPSCGRILTVDSVGRCNVAVCTCGQRMCWCCREPAHAPLSCPLLRDWRTVIKEDALQARWVVEHTKPCPKCNSRIEKNGGCNHMTCRTQNGGGCGHEFCWVCGHEWSTHQGDGYFCNKYVDFETVSRDSLPKGDLQRLNHYYTRHLNHLNSLATELGTKEKTRLTLMERFQRHDTDPISERNAAELFEQIFSALETARSVLIWSYPHAFYMAPNSTELRLFEHVQKEAERILEELADNIENRPWLGPNDYRVSARVLANNTEVLNKHVDQDAQATRGGSARV